MRDKSKRIVTRSIVYSLMDYREADQLVGLITRDHGPLSAVARHAKKSIKRFGARLDLLNVIDATLNMSKSYQGTLHRLDATDLIEPFINLSTSPNRFALGQAALETASAFWGEGDPQPELFDFLVEYLTALDEGKLGEGELLYVLLKILDHHGLKPVLSECAKCGNLLQANLLQAKSFQPVRGAVFIPASGGAICSDCSSADSIRVPIEALKSLAKGSELPIDRMRRIKMGSETKKQAWRTVTGFIRFLAQKDMKTFKYLENSSKFE